MIEIKYNNTNPFENICTTPYVEFSKESDGWWSASKQFTLQGQINCCGLTFNQVLEKQSQLAKNFNKNFQKLSIIETSDNQKLLECDHACIKSIKFDETDYAYILPFTIEIEAHDENSFEGQYFVKDPIAEYSINEEKDGLVKYVFTISAKGIAGNNRLPIQNAENWVKNLIYINPADPNLVSFTFPGLSRARIECDPLNPGAILFEQTDSGDIVTAPKGLIRSDNEFYDRSDNVYKRTIEFLVDPKDQQGTILVYKIKGNKERNGFVQITIDGTITAKDVATAREKFSSYDFFSVASAYSGMFGRGLNTYLNKDTYIFDARENFHENSISFSINYDNSKTFEYELIDNVTYNSPSISQPDSKASRPISVSVKGLVGTKKDRAELAGDIATKMVNGYDGVCPFPDPLVSLNQLLQDSELILFLSNGKNTEQSVEIDESEGAANGTADAETFQPISPDELCFIKSLEGTIEEELPCQQYNFKRALCPDWIAIPTHVSTKKKRANITLTYINEGDEVQQQKLKEKAKEYATKLIQSLKIGTEIKKVEYERTQDYQLIFEYEWEEIQEFNE